MQKQQEGFTNHCVGVIKPEKRRMDSHYKLIDLDEKIQFL
jgi:hypothetical protein